MNYDSQGLASPDGHPYVFDFYKWLAEDRDRCDRLVGEINALHRAVGLKYRGTGNMDNGQLRSTALGLMRKCGYNFGMLIPVIYHTLNNGRPMSLGSRPFMHVMTCLAPGYSVTLKAGRQVGKCVTGDTTVQTREGDVSLRYLFAMGR